MGTKLLAIILVSIIAILACKPVTNTGAATEQNTSPSTATPSPSVEWTETFTGTANDVVITFHHKNYTQFQLTIGLDTTMGALNTERGYLADEDATVYILNYDKPEADQWYFVRMTNGNIYMLDAQRNILPATEFHKVTSAQ